VILIGHIIHTALIIVATLVRFHPKKIIYPFALKLEY